ncbi:HU family DNA-binding protein [Roseburia sp. AF15-21]|uniref:HU family DNA-binding protein n=1 Tax=Roseburia sp. AF15-21 TaxID=2293128 RepID=UPI000E475D95|nr:HU family DNA-binding protein [Roseburia sp. AF15-21]RHR89436.1 HU family DNA-binding protein [Roseburia sp. AF15-21]
MTRRDFIRLVADNAGMPKYKARIFYNAFIETLMEVLESGDYVSLYGFGRFYIQDYDKYTTSNPRNPKEMISVPAHRRLKFDQSVVVKQYLNNDEKSEQKE